VTHTNGLLRVTAVLVRAPVFWYPEYWSEETRALEGIKYETPLSDRPWASFDVSPDVPLGELFDAALGAWNIRFGRGAFKYDHEPPETPAHEVHNFAFVQPELDAQGFDQERVLNWPDSLPVARDDGSIEQVPGLSVTYRELLASASLGLVEGDVTRPYVHPVRPQGEFEPVVEAARVTLDAIKAAYAHVDDVYGFAEHTIHLVRASLPEVRRRADPVLDEVNRWGTPITWLFGVLTWAKLRRKKND
jgi:hypothetical protein